jgi:hypothetical protein
MIKSNCKYQSTDIIEKNGVKTIRKVSIKNGKGYKSVCHYYKGKCTGKMKKQIHNDHIDLISNRKFVPGLFADCNKKTRKARK